MSDSVQGLEEESLNATLLITEKGFIECRWIDMYYKTDVILINFFYIFSVFKVREERKRTY